jgi:uncharacterized protein (TIGR02147 family)
METYKVLSNAFQRLKDQNPSFSIRALAKKIGISHVATSKLLKGDLNLSPKRVNKVIKALQLDGLAAHELKQSVIESRLEGMEKNRTQRRVRKKNGISPQWVEKSTKYMICLEHWYEMPILDLLTCSNPPRNAIEISECLNITLTEAESAVRRMIAVGLIEDKDGKLIKKEKFIRFPSNTPNEVASRYNQMVLKRVFEELKSNNHESYESRLIKNICLAVNPDKIKAARERLFQALYEISEELTDGDSNQIYFLGTFFFPVSSKR